MAQTSWPFENIDTTEVQFSQWARHINEGIRPDFANELEVFADDSGLNVKVKSGQAMVRGHYYASTAEETLTITTPDATNPRIDNVVLELDIIANSILLKVVTGTPAASPSEPALVQSEDGNIYQLWLAEVYVQAGVFSIVAGNVYDYREFMFAGVGKWNTITRPTNPIQYQTIGYNTDLNTHEVWNGSAWTSVFAPITTEGDLAIGNNTGTAVRLPIGAADTVLTSNGTTATWVEAAGGGGVTFANAPFDSLSFYDVDFPANSLVQFSIITTSVDTFSVVLLDSGENIISTVSVTTANPFTYFTNSTPVAKISVNNTIIDESVILVFTDPSAAIDPESTTEIISITTTQSITTNKTFTAYVFGGGGGGDSYSQNANVRAGGGGSGYFSTGTLVAGTYTATIGSGGGSGGDGGTSTIGTITAIGGKGASGSSGGDGGSGGGNAGNNGGFQGSTPSAGGTGSGVAVPQNTVETQASLIPATVGGLIGAGGGIYAGGGGASNTGSGGNALGLSGGGGGAGYPGYTSGGDGGAGFIVLIEV